MRRPAFAIFVLMVALSAAFIYLSLKLEKPHPSMEGALSRVVEIISIEQSSSPEGSLRFVTKGMLISAYGVEEDLRPGDTVRVTGRATHVSNLENKGYANYLRGKAIQYQMLGAKVERLSGNKNLSWVVDYCQRALGARVDVLFRRDAPMIKALLYGDRGEISKDVQDMFSKTGISHIIAISGFHIGILAGGILLLTGKLPAIWRYSLAMILIFCFVLLTGARPSSIRAGIFYGILVASIFLKKEYDILSAGYITASLLLLYNPFMLLDRGFCLSFMAIFSIGYFMPLIQRGINKFSKKYFRVLLGYVSITLGVQILTLPLTYYYFGRISTVSVFANVLCVPLITLVYPFIFSSLLLGSIPIIGEVLVLSVKGILNLFTSINQTLVSIPGSYLDFLKPSIAIMTGCYLLIFLLYYIYHQKLMKEMANESKGFYGLY